MSGSSRSLQDVGDSVRRFTETEATGHNVRRSQYGTLARRCESFTPTAVILGSRYVSELGTFQLVVLLSFHKRFLKKEKLEKKCGKCSQYHVRFQTLKVTFGAKKEKNLLLSRTQKMLSLTCIETAKKQLHRKHKRTHGHTCTLQYEKKVRHII